MQCDEARSLIGPLIDGEASGPRLQALRAHIGACGDCAQTLESYRRTSLGLKEAGRVAVPAGLEGRIRSALAAADGMIAAQTRTWLLQAAALVAACLLSVALTWAVLRPAGDELRVEQDVLSAHIRSLLQDSPIQVASSDPHSVKPWFNGRIEFAPVVKDLTAEGFPLAGARLDYIDGQRSWCARLHASAACGERVRLAAVRRGRRRATPDRSQRVRISSRGAGTVLLIGPYRTSTPASCSSFRASFERDLCLRSP